MYAWVSKMEKKTDCLLTSGTFFLTFKKILTVVKKKTPHIIKCTLDTSFKCIVQ